MRTLNYYFLQKPLLSILVLFFGANLSLINAKSETLTIECDNLVEGGKIGYDHGICYPGDVPDELVNLELPSGGSGEIEYIWIFTNDDPNEQIANWIPIQGSSEENYQPEGIFEDTWFRRCARRSECNDYIVESNWVKICVDKESPQFLFLPESYAANCNDEPIFAEPEFYDDCAGVSGFTHIDEVVDNGCEINYKRTWIVTDNCGKENFASQTVTTIDNEAPTITLLPPYENFVNGDTLYYECDFGIFFYEEDVMVSDNCDDHPDVTFVDDVTVSEDCEEEGYIRFLKCYWIAVDDCGNESKYILYIYEVDTQNPKFTHVPEDEEIECGQDPVFGTPEIYDNCDNDLSIEENTVVTGDACNYTHVRNWTIRDDCGNYATAEQTIYTFDNEAPEIHLVDPYGAVVDGDTLILNCYESINLSELDAIAKDNCDENPFVTFYDDFYQSENCAEDGYLIKMHCTWTAVDHCGNESSFSIHIYILDNDPPIFVDFLEDVTINCKDEPVFGTPEFYDDCDQDLTIAEDLKIVEIDCKTKYQKTWTLTDDCGNSTSMTQVIYSYDNEVPVIEQLLPVLGGFCDEYHIQYPIVSDDCDDDLDLHYTIDTIVYEDYIDLKINWTVIDDCGNEAYAYQAVTIPCGEGFVFTGFSAIEMADNRVSLEWNVRNEEAIAFYNVEVSKNGIDFESTNHSFETGSEIYQGQGKYKVELENAFNGRSFYRVKYLPQVANSVLSSMDEVIFNDANSNAIIYPNPFINNVTIEYANATSSRGNANLYDTMGNLIKTINVPVNTTFLVINLNDLDPGTYVLSYTMNSMNYAQRVVKLTD